MIQQRAVAVGRRAQLVEIAREQLRVVAVDLRQVRDELGHVVVVRQRVMRLGHADLRVGPRALLLADHEGDDARQVRLQRQQLQIHHQREVILERRRDALRLLERRQLDVALLLGAGDAPLDVSHGIGILLYLDAILRAEFGPQPGQLVVHRVQDALVLAHARLARAALGGAAVAEQALEHGARVVLHRQRLGGAAPCNRVGVGAAEDAGARAGVGRPVHRQLQRRQLRLLREVPRQQLVHRHVGEDLHLGLAAARGAGQERTRRAGVDVVPTRVEARQHEHLLAERCQRLEDRRQLEAAPFGLRQPVLHRHAVGHVERLEAVHRLAGGARPRPERRHHRIQHRQRQSGAHPPQHGASRQRFRCGESHGHPLSSVSEFLNSEL